MEKVGFKVLKRLNCFGRNACLRTGLMAAAIPLGVLVAAGPGRVEKTIDTTSNPRISISNPAGKVVVKGWDKSQVHAVLITSSPRIEVETEAMPSKGQAEKIHFSTQDLNPQAKGADNKADYVLEVPVGSSLEIWDPEGSVQVEKLQGDIRADSVSAPVSLADTSGHLAVKSVSGNIDLVRPAGRAEATSVNGNLHFVSPSAAELDGYTTTGAILYDGDFVSSSDYHLRTYSGNIDVRCPAAVSLELRARTSRGKLENPMKMNSARHPAPHYGNAIFGTHNSGKATLELQSFSGNIRIHPEQ